MCTVATAVVSAFRRTGCSVRLQADERGGHDVVSAFRRTSTVPSKSATAEGRYWKGTSYVECVKDRQDRTSGRSPAHLERAGDRCRRAGEEEHAAGPEGAGKLLR